MGSTLRLRLRERWGGCRLTREILALFYELSLWSLLDSGAPRFRL
ncbi:unnamed protein product [Acanthoscelides obtectus]|uniref:Uncharacterized protein n=1 Tax=Acanthoscelides obtectus TaxID=200917 RepID=A0A9P0PTV6_ACAOB|nr:unnamed protein product [Acanthoscelides obtectus]CAK1670042.1 hypothetical protein AOBTE_LOCUS27364 [Acanthoscelides obtectus]